MQPEHRILAAIIVDRTVHEQLSDYLSEADFTAQGNLIRREVIKYYDDDNTAQRVDTGLLIDRIQLGLSTPKQAESFREIIAELPYDIGAHNVATAVLEHKREGAADRLANALLSTAPSREEINKLLTEYGAIHEATDLADVNEVTLFEPDLKAMFTETLSDANKIKVAPKPVNDALGGGALPGHCLIVFGRVEMGKSLFVLNMAAGFVQQKKSVLFIENEDTLVDTKRRFTQRLIRRPREWCMEHPDEMLNLATERRRDLFWLTDKPESPKDVEAAIHRLQPDVVIINQMRNMVSGENQAQKLDSLAHSLRRIGKLTNTLMVLVTAAREGDSDSQGYIRPKPILELGDVYGSRTGIPAAADALFGWGGSEDMKRARQACVNICKNKLVDEGGHEHLYLTVDPSTGVITGERE